LSEGPQQPIDLLVIVVSVGLGFIAHLYAEKPLMALARALLSTPPNPARRAQVKTEEPASITDTSSCPVIWHEPRRCVRAMALAGMIDFVVESPTAHLGPHLEGLDQGDVGRRCRWGKT